MSLRERLDIIATPWLPRDDKAGHPQDIVGRVLEIEEGESEFGPYPRITVAGDDGHTWMWGVLGEVAQNRVAKLGIEVGDEVGVRYLGEEPAKNFPGKTYSNWRIVMEKGSKASAQQVLEGMAETAEEPF